MSEEHLLSLLKESGSILFAYCDKYNFYMVYKPFHDNVLYLVTCDKGLYVTSVDRVELPNKFFICKDIRFFKPIASSGKTLFSGLAVSDEETFRFEFDESGKHSFERFDKEVKENNTFNLLESLKNITVVHGIQRAGKFYFTGTEYEPETGTHPVYGVVDLTSDKLERVYCLYTDCGEIETSAVAIDTHECTVYVVGKIHKLDSNNETVDQLPYLEKFFYRG